MRADRGPQPRDNLLDVAAPDKETKAPRTRMTGSERRHQLIDIARSLFAERGYEGTSIEEIALRANVSKPVVYEHFGGKEGLYAVVVDREMSSLLDRITSSLTNNRSRVRVETVALALLTYVEEHTDGFRIMIRDSPASISSGTYSSLLNDAVSQVSSILAGDFARRGLGFRPCPAVRAGAGRIGVDDRTVVARHPGAQEGSGGRPPGQLDVERPDPSGSRPASARRVATRHLLVSKCPAVTDR